MIANKSITILAGQMTLSMGSNRIVVQPGASQFAFTGYSAGWGPDQSYTAGGTTLQYTGNGSAFKVGASTGTTNFIRLESFQVDASTGGSSARAMEIDNTIGATLSNLKLLASTVPGTTQEALRLDATGGMNAYMLLNNLYLGGGHNTLHLAGASGQLNSAFQIIGGTARTNNTTDGTGVLLEYASNMDFVGFDVESAFVASNVEVEAGDTIMVSKAGLVYVVGDVGRPGGFIMDNNEQITVLQVLALAQGVSRSAAMGSAASSARPRKAHKKCPFP